MAGSDINSLTGVVSTKGTAPKATAVTKRQELPSSGKPAPQESQQSPPPEDSKQLERAVVEISTYVQSINRELQFSIDSESGRTVITVLDSATQEVVRQIPSDEVLSTARAITTQTKNKPKGVLFQSRG